MRGLLIIVVLAIALASIIYVWRRLVTEGVRHEPIEPGTVLGRGEAVHRIDLGANVMAAQAAHNELSELGITTKLVSVEQRDFSAGLGDRWYLVYNPADEAQVRNAVDGVLDDL